MKSTDNNDKPTDNNGNPYSTGIPTVDKALVDFQALELDFNRYTLAEYLKAHREAEPDIVAELLADLIKPRQRNQNGCTCRIEDGEACSRCSNWHDLFHNEIDTRNAPPITFAIDGFLQNDAITMIGGLPGHSKTFLMLSTAKALLTGEPLFGYEGFKVPKKAETVVYLCPESSLTPFAHRVKRFGLDKFVNRMTGSFFYRTISRDLEQLNLTDLRLQHAVDGAHVFLDTAVRFMEGDENSASDQRQFANTLFRLLQSGAKTVTAAHHAPKGSENVPAERLTLENILRGTGELGAMVATCWALKQLDGQTNTVFVKNVKGRDFQPCEPFVLAGRPYIDRDGDFLMATKPGMYMPPKTEKKSKTDARRAEALELKAAGKTTAQIAMHFNVDERTVRRWKLDKPDISPDNSCPD